MGSLLFIDLRSTQYRGFDDDVDSGKDNSVQLAKMRAIRYSDFMYGPQ
ncbi:hypothetical protein MED297_00945 [Reinekea sp. MED297]|uniref:Uncharacterized protein n=1 Tax=Reinekea blandensis MED297 TaxID=314283 RepID=A4BBK9_9GAMM|nr:hypothetical protein MED297_00945 [Reinekea sp. MED297] [Reinekea blandensis MED297]